MPDFSAPYANLQTGQQDPSKFLGLLNSMNQLQDFQSRQAVGQAWQQSGGDPDKFLGLMQANPAAALHAGQATADAAALKGQNIINATGQFGLNTNQTKFMADWLASKGGRGMTDKDIAQARTLFAANGIPPQVTEPILNGGPGDTRTPQQIAQDLQEYVMGPAGRGGPLQATGVIPKGLPGAGNQTMGTPAQAMRAATTPPQNPAMPPGVVTALQPSTQKQMDASASQMGQDAQAASDYRNRIQPLENVIPLLEKLGPRGTGIGSELKAQLAKIGVTFGAGDSDAKIYDETRKYMLQDAMRNGEIGTNDKLVATTSSNPNMDLVQGANVDLAKAALAQRRIKQVQVLEAQRQGVDPGQYQDWATQWNTSQDPRAYIVDHMTPKARGQMLDQVEANLKSNDPNAVAQAKQFLESYKTARQFPGVMDLTKLQPGK
jgi:hypothetical protein